MARKWRQVLDGIFGALGVIEVIKTPVGAGFLGVRLIATNDNQQAFRCFLHCYLSFRYHSLHFCAAYQSIPKQVPSCTRTSRLAGVVDSA
jgi:hypothetical protein